MKDETLMHGFSYYEFISGLQQLWQQAGHLAKIFRKDSADNLLEENLPCIVYHLIDRVPFQGKGVRPERRPQRRGYINHPDNPDKFVEVFGQMFSMTVEFTVCSLNANEADDLVGEFEDFMYLYNMHFQNQRIIQLNFLKQLEDKIDTRNSKRVHMRPLQFVITYERRSHRILNPIQNLGVKAQISHDEKEE
jgi:hypothetical protein